MNIKSKEPPVLSDITELIRQFIHSALTAPGVAVEPMAYAAIVSNLRELESKIKRILEGE